MKKLMQLAKMRGSSATKSQLPEWSAECLQHTRIAKESVATHRAAPHMLCDSDDDNSTNRSDTGISKLYGINVKLLTGEQETALIMLMKHVE